VSDDGQETQEPLEVVDLDTLHGGAARFESDPLPSPPTSGSRVSWPDKLWWALTLPFGLTTWAAFLYAGSRTKRRDLKQAAGIYAAALIIAVVMTSVGEGGGLGSAGGAVLVLLWIAGMVHAALIRRTVSRQLALEDNSAVRRAQKELDRREYGRQLLSTNPSLARQLGVGRPDVAGSDSYGLIDVNHAGAAGLMMLPGLTQGHVQKLIQYRNDGGYFVSVEDLVMYLDLPQTTIGPLRDTAIFDLGA
jgi:DNA uptake protein ComE-like DNA-binding protein